MTKDEVITHFWEFLYETGAACEYVEAYSIQPKLSVWLQLCYPQDFIIAAFYWGDDDMVADYWKKIDDGWMQRLNALNNCK